jgi:hypothetical protein
MYNVLYGDMAIKKLGKWNRYNGDKRKWKRRKERRPEKNIKIKKA